MNSNMVNILLVEDDEVDVEAIKRAFRISKIGNPLVIVKDGLEALQALRGEGEFEPLPRPNMVLLDLNMPRMNGVEFLTELRKDPDIKDTIVIVLTTSDDDEDKINAYDKNVAGYLVKSRIGKDFTHLVDLLNIYWCVVEFPPDQRLIKE